MTSEFTAFRETLRQATAVSQRIRLARARSQQVTQMVVGAHEEFVQRDAWRQLEQTDLDRLREMTSASNLRLAPLRALGIDTIAQLLRTPDQHLASQPALGGKRLLAIRGAAAEAFRAAIRVQPVILEPQARTPVADRLVGALAEALRLRQSASELAAWCEQHATGLASRLAAAKPMTSRLRWVFTGRATKLQAAGAARGLAELLAHRAPPESAIAQLLSPPPPDQIRAAWDWFVGSAPDFYAELERLTGSNSPERRAHGGLTDEILARVEAQELDDSLLRGMLRNYQHFGARYLLAQGRAILGDEMGLGKTFQAIAALAHLAANGQRHFLVIAPASVLVGWQRELLNHSRLTPHLVHGPDRATQLQRWRHEGGVAITTFEQLARLPLSGCEVGAVVIDEAHYIKNPQTRRARLCQQLLAGCERGFLLTGTPMENCLAEFEVLVGYLQPSLVADRRTGQPRVAQYTFRQRMAPVYLRRNQADVLLELPECINIDDWLELSAPETVHYHAAVKAGDFMAMRRAAFAGGSHAGKLQRLTQICAEAGMNGRKVVVFSFFLDVLELVRQALGERAMGPLTGAVSPTQRQDLIDQFTAAPTDRVLLAQVAAGGVGLNIQAASVVVLCEPQLKPSTEAQAIARVHRMGQVRRVEVHRLLACDSVDERIVEILAEKQELFDRYVRESVIAQASSSAQDPARAGLAQLVMRAERARLGYAANRQPTDFAR